MAKRAKRTTDVKRAIESYDHQGKKRVNNPPVRLVTPDTDPDAGQKKNYQYDPRLDPQLVWAGRPEHTSFQVPIISLQVHERIDPRTIIEATKDSWSRLAKNLKPEIDEELIEAYRGTVSLPFDPGHHKRVAVKIIDDRGIESLKIVEVG